MPSSEQTVFSVSRIGDTTGEIQQIGRNAIVDRIGKLYPFGDGIFKSQ